MTGRKLSENSIYARELGMENIHNATRAIKRLGGARKLRALSPEVRNIFLSRLRSKKNLPEAK